MSAIILASASPRRKELLNQMGLSFTVIPSCIAEPFIPGMKPEQMVKTLALTKAMDVAQRCKKNTDQLVIGADTIVVKDDKIYGKPVDANDAMRILSELQGTIHQVYTGVAIVDPWLGQSMVDVERTLVQMKSLSYVEIERYVASGEPLDKAGAYGIQGKGAILVTRLEGCYFNVVGLPIAKLACMLDHFGVIV